MPDIPPRCPFCANVLKIQPSFWSHLGFKAGKVRCPTCQRDFEARDAETMGSQYWNWAEQFRKQLTEVLFAAPILSEPAAMRVLGNPSSDETRLIPSLDELVRNCLRHHRHALIEMVRGREATLEVVPLQNQTTNVVEAAAIISTTSVESGGQRHEQIVTRTGMTHFVLLTYTGEDGIEPRVKRALHEKGHIGTKPQAVANMQSRHGETPAKHA
jgi:hypothetical protein